MDTYLFTFSYSSMLIAAVAATILILAMYIISKDVKHYYLYRIGILEALLFFIFLRLIFPVELPFTITITASFMNSLFLLIEKPVFMNLRVIDLLVIVWVIGSIIAAWWYVKTVRSCNQYFDMIEKSARKQKLSDYLELKDRDKDYDVYISEYVNCPMVIGFHPIIFLPDMSFDEEQLKYIMLHESQHLRSHDAYLCLAVNILVIIYWWFLPVYLLRKIVQFFLELRVDHNVTKKLPEVDACTYSLTLVQVQQKLRTGDFEPHRDLALQLISENPSILTYRISYMEENLHVRKTAPVIILCVAMVPLLSNLIVLEPYFDKPVGYGNNTYYSADDLIEAGAYILEKTDESYYMIFDSQEIRISDMATIEDLVDEGMRLVEVK